MQSIRLTRPLGVYNNFVYLKLERKYSSNERSSGPTRKNMVPISLLGLSGICLGYAFYKKFEGINVFYFFI